MGVDSIIRVRYGKDSVVLSVVWENPDVMLYVKLGSRSFDAKRFGALPSHGNILKVIYGGRSRTTVYGI